VNELSVLEQARAGDAHAFEAILRPMIQPAYRLALAMLGEREAAEDAVQEMALKAWRYRGRLRPELGSARPWFLAIVANECRMARRRRWWNVIRLASAPDRPGAEGDVAGRLDLRDEIARLPYRDRELLHLYYVLDLPAAEVATVLNLSVGAVKTRLHRITGRLRPRLEPVEIAR